MAEEKTIIIKNEEEKKSNFTLKNIVASIKIYRYWILGISLIFAVFVYLLTSLGINRNLAKVSSTFSYSFATDSYLGTEAKLFDGTTVNINSIISSGNIRDVYNNTLNEKGEKVFQKLNIDSIIEDSNISLTLIEDKNLIERKSTDPVSMDKFTLTANIKPFKNADNAKLFVQELINSLPKRVYDLFNQYKGMNLLSGYNENDEFYSSVSALNDQYKAMVTKYNQLEVKYTKDEFISSEGKSLGEVKNSFANNLSLTYNLDVASKARSDLLVNGYVNNFDGTNKTLVLEELNTRESNLTKLKEDIIVWKDIIKSAIESYQSVNIYTTTDEKTISISTNQFEEYVKEYERAQYFLDSVDSNIELITVQKEKVNNYDDTYIRGCQEFKRRLTGYVDMVNIETDRLSKVQSEIAKKRSSSTALFSSPKLVDVKMSFPSILFAGVGLVLAFVVSSLIYTYVNLNKSNSEDTSSKESKSKK